MDKRDYINYWNYFIFIDKDLFNTNRYIQHSEKNLMAYSSEFARIILVACAEIDTICRLLCKEIDNTCDFSDDSTRSGDIRQYSGIILSRYPKLTTTEVELTTLQIKKKSWKGWENKPTYQSPQWWKDYQMIKHYRHLNFEKANLENALLSVSSLFILLLYLHKTAYGFTFNPELNEPKCMMSLSLFDMDDRVLDKYEYESLPDF